MKSTLGIALYSSIIDRSLIITTILVNFVFDNVMTSYYYSISIDDTYGLFFLEILLAMQNWMYNIIQLGHKMKMNLLIPCESKFEKFVFLSVRPSVGRSIRSSVIRPSVSTYVMRFGENDAWRLGKGLIRPEPQ